MPGRAGMPTTTPTLGPSPCRPIDIAVLAVSRDTMKKDTMITVEINILFILCLLREKIAALEIEGKLLFPVSFT
jgi:hypothetical protein